MQALVLSGGANFGAMQAGALAVLVEAGLRPEMVVGSSAGALNSLSLASNPSESGMEELLNNWRRVGPEQVGKPTILGSVYRLVTGKYGLIPNQSLASFLQATFSPQMTTFGDLFAMHGVRAYTVAVCMETGETVAFGDHEDDRIIDGAMASISIPPFFPPWEVKGCHYLDGGVTAKLPIQIAVQRGALEIIALDVFGAMGSLDTVTNMISLSGYALSMVMEDQTKREIRTAKLQGVSLRVIKLLPPADIEFWNYAEVERLIQSGRVQARRALAKEPLEHKSKLGLKLRRSAALAMQKVFI